MEGSTLSKERVPSQKGPDGFRKEGEGRPTLLYYFLSTKKGRDWVEGESERIKYQS